MSDASRPLDGIRVLDLSRILAGPWASQTLADLGADVIKVERPGAGDDTRGWGPPFVDDSSGERGDAAYFLSCNRGKRSVTIDFTRPEGAALVRDLAVHCDVLLENFKVGGLEKYGLHYAGIAEVNPRLVYCSITGFGQTGPYAARPGYDFLIQAMGGLMSVTGERDDRPGGGPQKVGVALTDIMTGLYACVGVLAALRERDRSGCGQHVDLALLDVQVAGLANQALNYLVTGVAPKRLGNDHPSIVPYQALPASDGHIIIAIGNDSQFKSFCEAAGRTELAADSRFLTNRDRVVHREAMTEILEAMTRTRTVAEWTECMEAAGVPCGPINTLDRVFDDAHVQARGLRRDIAHPRYGSVPAVANPIRLADIPVASSRPPPGLGEHSEEVFRELLKLDKSKIEKLRAEGIS